MGLIVDPKHQLVKLYLSALDFDIALATLRHLESEIEHSKDSPVHQGSVLGSFFAAFVVQYARPFSVSKGGSGTSGIAVVSLGDWFTSQFDAGTVKIHDWLMTLRHRVVAHTDADFVLEGLDAKSHGSGHAALVSVKGFPLNRSEIRCPDLRPHVEGVSRLVQSNIDAKIKQIGGLSIEPP